MGFFQMNEVGEDETPAFEQRWCGVLEHVVGSMCTGSDCYTYGRVAYGYCYSDCIHHANSHSYGGANWCFCGNGVGHTHAGADFDADADCHANT